MSLSYKYIRVDENGRVSGYYETPVKGVTIDIEGIIIPEQPTDAIYDLYYNEKKGLHYVKVANFESETLNQDELQWQAITDLEISQMEYNQALTDLEIKYLEGGINI